MSNSTDFTYKALEKKCPSCGESLLLAGSYLLCQREHGAVIPPWAWIEYELPVATRTARVGRFTIEGEEGFWKVPSHMDKELLHDGPEEGSVVASIFRYNSRIPTAVAFVRGKKPKGHSAASRPVSQ